MHPVVEITPDGGTRLSVVVTGPLELGRECDGVLIADPVASRRHLSMRPEGMSVVVADLGSSNGTLLNGSPLSGPGLLGPGDEVKVGNTVLRLSNLVANAPTKAPPNSGAGRQTAARSRKTAALGPAPAAPPPVVRPTRLAESDARATSIDRVATIVRGDTGVAKAVDELAARTGGTVTFAFSDIESSTELAAAMGDQRWFARLDAHNRVIEGITRDHDGRVVKGIGDGYLLTFPGARRAVEAAVAMQRAMAESADGVQPLRIRIGLHTGEAIESGGDLFGNHVNTAARVAGQAAGGEIVVSSITRAITEPGGDLRYAPEEQVALKGLPGLVGVSRLIWQD